MSEHEDGRELSLASASSAMGKAFPRITAIHKAQRSLEQSAQGCLLNNGGPIDAADDESYVMVRRGDFEGLEAALAELEKARAL